MSKFQGLCHWLLATSLLFGVIPTTAVGAPRPGTHRSKPLPSASPQVFTMSFQVAELLQQNDSAGLSRYVDQERGLQISPEVYASRKNVKLTRQQVARLRSDKTRRIWGDYDGEDGPIRLTWNDYRKKFVWNRNFTRSTEISVNQIPKGHSTVINNLRQFYPHSTLVEFYLPPTSRDNMDWASLWMIWKKRGTTWRLIGIAHDQWSP